MSLLPSRSSPSSTPTGAQAVRRWTRFLPALVLALLAGLATVFLVPLEEEIVRNYLRDFPSSSELLHGLRPLILSFALWLPAIFALLYACCGLLDRYLIRRLFSTYLLCLSAFGLIWLLLDLQNNFSDFQNAQQKLRLLITYYLVQLPALFALLSPFALLLACLYLLNQMSAQREVVAVMQTGRGLLRFLAPLIGVGAALSLFLTLLNYHWTTWGDTYKDSLKGAAQHNALIQAEDVLAYSAEGKRLWYVGLFPRNYDLGTPLQQVEITFLNREGRPEKRLRARSAQWDKNTVRWTLNEVEELQIDGKRLPEFQTNKPVVTMDGWPETPSQLIRPGLQADQLSLPELSDWIKASREQSEWIDLQPYRTQWHFRLAQPWNNLISVLLAAPLGIVFSRRGTLGGIAIALLLSGLLLFTTELVLTLGSGGYLQPVIAAWGANLLFACVALILLLRRAKNRPIYATLHRLLALLGGKN